MGDRWATSNSKVLNLGCPTIHLSFKLSLALLSIHGIGLEEVTKNFQRYRQKNVYGNFNGEMARF